MKSMNVTLRNDGEEAIERMTVYFGDDDFGPHFIEPGESKRHLSYPPRIQDELKVVFQIEGEENEFQHVLPYRTAIPDVGIEDLELTFIFDGDDVELILSEFCSQ